MKLSDAEVNTLALEIAKLATKPASGPIPETFEPYVLKFLDKYTTAKRIIQEKSQE